MSVRWLGSLGTFQETNLWQRRFGGGVPCKQYNLIGKDKLSIAAYVARTLDGVAQNSHLRSDNYFYFNCLTGRCAISFVWGILHPSRLLRSCDRYCHRLCAVLFCMCSKRNSLQTDCEMLRQRSFLSKGMAAIAYNCARLLMA